MNPNEMKLEYPWDTQLPEPGHAIEVGEGVLWIRMPLPFALDHINLWLLRDTYQGKEGWTVIDCGVSNTAVKDLWEQVFDSVLQGLPILRVIVTHMHPDHVGLAGWLCERWSAPLYMSMTDFMTARLWSMPGISESGGGPNGVAAEEHFAKHGLVDKEARRQIRERANYYPDLVPFVPTTFNRLIDGATLTIGKNQWRCIAGYGHAPEHIALYSAEAGILISGDMLLPRISTNVSVFNYEPESNPLPLYLDSLDAYEDLAEDTLVLPSHGRPFKGVQERISQQHEHHEARLQEVLDACVAPKSTHDIIPVLFRRELDLHQLTFAMGEALAHLHALYFEGKLRREMGEDGIYRFQTV